jgi:hypothetical protein
MEITLIIDEKEKIFIAPFIKARMLRTTMGMSNEFNSGNFTVESLDKIVDYEVKLYGEQFTVDQLYDGFPANKLVNKVLDDMNSVMGTMDNKIKNIAAKN